jgi:hypothetical protein
MIIINNVANIEVLIKPKKSSMERRSILYIIDAPNLSRSYLNQNIHSYNSLFDDKLKSMLNK